jgi:tetratricopeptide (TPR) repeat protein/DNA-binding XRE family transcriptional regulator
VGLPLLLPQARGDALPEVEFQHSESFALALRRVRKSKGLSLQDLAGKAHYSKGYLSKIENGKLRASLDCAQACDQALAAGGWLVARFAADRSSLGSAAGAGPGPGPGPVDIPPPPGHFTGREAESAQVLGALVGPPAGGRAPAVLIHGRAGSGKTALALHVAHLARDRYPDGCLFLDFESGRDQGPQWSPHACVLRRLGVAAADIPAEPGEVRALYRSVLYSRAVLVVADGVTRASQVADLVPATPACAVIATGRRRLDALGDWTLLPLGAQARRPAGDAAGLAGSVPHPAEDDQAVRRLIAGFVHTAMAADRAIMPPRFQPAETTAADVAPASPPVDTRAQAMAWGRAEAGNIPLLCALAFEQELDEECWRLAYAMRDYFFTVGVTGPWVASHLIALAAAERSGHHWAQAVTRNNLGMAYAKQRQFAVAGEQYSRALELHRRLDDHRGVATTLGHQAWASHAAGRHDEAIALAGQAQRLHRQHDDRRSLAIMDRTAALAHSKAGRHHEALALLGECQDILTEFDLPLDLAMTDNCQGEVELALGHASTSAGFHARAAERSRDCGGATELDRAIRGAAAAGQA